MGALWCNIRGACHRFPAFPFKEDLGYGGLGLEEGHPRPGPASGGTRPWPVVTDATGPIHDLARIHFTATGPIRPLSSPARLQTTGG